jgi:hypothetical protein
MVPDYAHAPPMDGKSIFFLRLGLLLSRGHILLLLLIHKPNMWAYTYILVVIKEISLSDKY